MTGLSRRHLATRPGGASRAGLAAGALVAALLAVTGAPAVVGGAPPPDEARPFTDQSAWNAPIPDDAGRDPRSEAMMELLIADDHATANLDEYGVPVYEAEDTTPRHEVTCTEQWGPCDLEDGPVPIPDGARPSPGTDGAMVVIDPATDRSYEFWRARRTPDGGWTASWGGVVDLTGDGHTPGAGQTGAGVSRLAGVVRTSEIEVGAIPHALVFSTDNACLGDFRYPATKTDGWSERDDCLPQGARIQLDPAVDVAEIPEMDEAERAVARALQTHGAYAVDNGGARMAFIFETPTSAEEGDRYPAAGLQYDYQPLEHIPWDRVHVLRRWNGH